MSSFDRLSKFGIFGVASYGINVIVTSALHEGVDLPTGGAFAIALVVTTLINFAVCRWLIFKSDVRSLRLQLTAFGVSAVAWRGAEYVLFLILTVGLSVQYIVSITIVTGCSFLGKFFWYQSVVFGPGTDEMVAGDRS